MSSIPKIRFKGFTDDWEQRKLDDVVEFLDTMRKPLEGAKRISGPYPYYGASGIVDYVDGYLFDEELIHALAEKPSDVSSLSKKQKQSFVHLFRTLDHDFAHLKAFSRYSEDILNSYEFSEEEYEDYAAMYRNVVEEFQSERDPSTSDGPVVNDYDLIAYHKIKIDFEYLVELLQGFVDSLHPETNNQKQSDFQDKIKEIREMVNEFSQSNQKMGNLLSIIVEEIENDSRKYFRQDISAIINRMRDEAINKEILAFAKKWFISPEKVRYHVQHFQNGIIANETNLKEEVIKGVAEKIMLVLQ